MRPRRIYVNTTLFLYHVPVWLVNVIVFRPRLVLRDNDMDSENISLIRLAVFDSRKSVVPIYNAKTTYKLFSLF